MKYINIKLIAAMAVILLAQACSTHSNLYYWGDYQEIVYDIYLNPGEADTATQIYKLNLTIERAENKGMKVPPGLYAHLGMVHAQAGNPGLAKSALLQEKALYPESSVFVDGILTRSNMQDTA
ncbi:hypothetical protein A3741_27825, partial [Oleiphilus sp. HI0069]